MSVQPQKLDPRSSMYLRGFDRRGAAASIHDVTDNGFTLSGVFSDQADFAVLMLYDEDDLYGHLTTSKYLPDSSLIGVKLDFDYAGSGLMPLESYKFASVSWNQLSYIAANGASGAGYLQPLLTGATGMLAATGQWQVMASSGLMPNDVLSLWYQNLNFQFTYPNNPAGSSTTSGNMTFGTPQGAGTSWTLTVSGNMDTTPVINTYTYTEQSGDSSFTIAQGIAAAVNGVPNTGSSTNGPDQFVTANAIFAIPNCVVTPILDTGHLVELTNNSPLDSALYTLIETQSTVNHGIANNIAYQINNVPWATSIQPTTALMATVSGSYLTVIAARYGKALLNGTSVVESDPSTFYALTSNQSFLGSNVGDPIVINGSGGFTITAVLSPTGVSITPSGPSGNVTGVYTAPGAGVDGNSIEMYEQHSSSGMYLSPIGSLKLVGGQQATKLHMHLDFSGLSISSLRQAWFTIAPNLQYNSIQGASGTLVPFTPSEFKAVYSNWTVTDPNGVRPLYVAGSGSQVVNSRQTWVQFYGDWNQEAGDFYHGFASASSVTGDYVTVKYACGYPHNLYLGTALYIDRGKFAVTLDGVSQTDLDCYLDVDPQLITRRLIASGVASGTHNLTLEIDGTKNPDSTGYTCYFDYIHAVANPQRAQLPTGVGPTGYCVPPTGGIYTVVGGACDFDTDQTYKLAPERLQYVMQHLGFSGNIDFYAGVFFALKRARVGGYFHQATITISGAFAIDDSVFLNFGGYPPVSSGGQPTGGTDIGKTIVSVLDTNAVIAQHLAYFINETFVAVWASASGNVLTVTSLSPINGSSLYAFTLNGPDTGPSASGMAILTGDVETGNEGIWGVDATQSLPLNRAFSDYLGAWCRALVASGQLTTVAFSQELLGPPDVNSASGAWSQRFNSGVQVLTDTGFGSWGAGVVQAIAGITVTQYGHGYITGNIATLSGPGGTGQWSITVLNVNQYQLTTLLAGGYSPSIGDNVFIELQTVQCTFNPSTFGAYIPKCYIQAANIMSAAGLPAWLQLGEVGWWFFSSFSESVSNVEAYGASGTQITTAAANPFNTGDTVVIVGVEGSAGNGTYPITVINSSTFVVPVVFTGTYTSGGTVYGGSMAYYDAYTQAAALTTLGRPLAVFTSQDSDPSINSFADANFLRTELYNHMHNTVAAIHTAATGSVSMEWLLPLDVNSPSLYWNYGYPFAQGGRMNNYVNIPAQYMSATGSDIQRLKMEALSWGATYRYLMGAMLAVQYGYQILTWPTSKVFYLIPIENGSCPWVAEYLFAITQNLPGFNFWALDHMILFSWDVPLPVNLNQAFHT